MTDTAIIPTAPAAAADLEPAAAPLAPLAPADLDAIAATVRAALEASKAPATRRAYRAAWKAFADWTAAHGAASLPAAPDTVAAYLAARVQDGAGLATLNMARAAIGAAHKAAGHPNPAGREAEIVREVMNGFTRQAADNGRRPRQARALDAEAVAAIRGSLNGRADSNRYTACTMALVSVLSDAGLRISEAAALTWQDVAPESDGSARITIGRSKTDQDGSGAVVAITAAAAADLERLRRLDGQPGPDAPVFGLSDRQIARRVKAAAAGAGLGSGFSGHSGRVGMAIRMTRNGAPGAAVEQHGRWKSGRMVNRYTRAIRAGEALRYL